MFIEIVKAFKNGFHDSLIIKRYQTGVSWALELTKSNLSGKKQRVKLNDVGE